MISLAGFLCSETAVLLCKKNGIYYNIKEDHFDVLRTLWFEDVIRFSEELRSIVLKSNEYAVDNGRWCNPFKILYNFDCIVSGLGNTFIQRDKQIITSDSVKCFLKGNEDFIILNNEDVRIDFVSSRITEEAEMVFIFYKNESGDCVYLGYTFGNDITDIGLIFESPLAFGKAKKIPTPMSHDFHISLPPDSFLLKVSSWLGNAENYHFIVDSGIKNCQLNFLEIKKIVEKNDLIFPRNKINFVMIGCEKSSYREGFFVKNEESIFIESMCGRNVSIKNKIIFR